MAKLRDFKVDGRKDAEGVWVDVGDGLKLLIAGGDNPEYRKYRDKLLQPHLRKVRFRRISVEDLEDITKRAMAKHVLLGWKNLEDDAGEPIPYSSEKALEVLRESRELFTIIGDYAEDRALFRLELQEDAGKNS